MNGPTGETQHMCFDRNCLNSYERDDGNQKVYLGDNTTHNILEKGSVTIKLLNGLEKVILYVLYVSGLKKNLFSAKQFDNVGGEIHIKLEICTLTNKKGELIATCQLDTNLYKLGDSINLNPITAMHALTFTSKADLWHLRSGHINQRRLREIQSMSKGIDSFNVNEINSCIPCMQGKQHKIKFPKEKENRTTEILELVHTDICGPLQTPTHSGFTYFITFIDDLTRYTHVFLMRRKSEAFTKFLEYKTFVERQTNMKIRVLRSDQGGEYKSNEFNEYCQKEGIKREFTTSYTPQQNGVSERKNRTLVGAILAMLSHAQLPKVFWGEAFLTNYLQDKSPTKSVSQNKTPFELWFHRQPNLSFLRIFGCKAHVLI